MAIATTAAITGGLALASSVGQIASGISGKKKNQKALNNLEVPEIENAFTDIPISTVGSDLIREESSRTNASLVNAVQGGDFRSVLSAIPKISALNNNTNAEAKKYLDDQVLDKGYAVAKDNIRIQGVNENRYQQELQGLGQAIESNRQDIWSGVRGVSSSGAYLGRNMESGAKDEDPYQRGMVHGVSEVTAGGTIGLGPTTKLTF